LERNADEKRKSYCDLGREEVGSNTQERQQGDDKTQQKRRRRKDREEMSAASIQPLPAKKEGANVSVSSKNQIS